MPDNQLGGTPARPGAPAPPPAFRFLTLGTLALEHERDGRRIGFNQRRKLAVLALLAIAPRPVSRDSLVEMFWGDEDEERARHSLSNALSFLRGILGPSSITSRKSEVALAPDTNLWTDAAELTVAARTGRADRVVELYQGPFLDGVVVPHSISFDNWASTERARFEALFVKACETVCATAAAARDWDRCAAVARRWVHADPLSSSAALHVLNALRAGNTPDHRKAALAEYDRLVARLAIEFEATPHASVAEMAARIAARAAVDQDMLAAAITTDDVPVAPDVPVRRAETSHISHLPSRAAETPERPVPRTPRNRSLIRRSFAWPLIGVGLVLVAALGYSRRAASTDGVLRRPLLAVTDIASRRPDTSAAWLEDGFAQLISADLARSATVEVITPDRLRDIRRRANLAPSGALDPNVATNLARRLGVSHVVRGGFTHGNGVYVLDVSLLDIGSPSADRAARTARTATFSGADPSALAQQAAARVVVWSIASGTKPRFSDLETSSIPAYEHLVRSLQARAEGRIQDWRRELDRAIALDSAFAPALAERADAARADADTAVLAILDNAMRRAHLSTWDALRAEVDSAVHNGELGRSEQLARQLVAQYPHDPRSLSVLAELYNSRGDWRGYERTAQRQLALDSLANEAGTGPCVPCTAYRGLVEARIARGDIRAAEQAARRWLTLQPDLPGGWANLGEVLFDSGREGAALDAERRALMLSGNDPAYKLRLARTLVMARQLGAADSLARSWTGDDPKLRGGVTDIHVLVLREEGRYRESIRASEAYMRTYGTEESLLYEELDALGRLGEYASARRLFNTRIGGPADARAMRLAPRGDAARRFTWTRALEANAIAGAGDTVRLRAIADSMELIEPRSYYGRDWQLYHHVLGLVAMRAGRYEAAEQEFQRARWGIAGWTATVAWLARAQMAAHRPAQAIETLRDGYRGPLDAMGRYVPRSELDYLMSVAFKETGQRDSANAYSSRVRRAWRRADPELRQLLDAL